MAYYTPSEDTVFNKVISTAENLISAKKFMDAIHVYWDYLDTHKQYPASDTHMMQVTFALGVLYFKIGKFDLSLKQLTKIANVDPQYPHLSEYFNQCKAKVGSPGQVKWADSHLTTITEIVPETPQILKVAEDRKNLMGKLNENTFDPLFQPLRDLPIPGPDEETSESLNEDPEAIARRIGKIFQFNERNNK